MRKFILQTSLFVLLTGLSFAWILSSADGYTDPYYLRLTTPRQSSLILGTSRAAQGLQPGVIREILKVHIYNYAFTNSHSPYGPTYLNSIRKKVDPATRNGVFIVTVDPWTIAGEKAGPNDSLNFKEIDLFLGNTEQVDADPNFSYLLNNFGGNYYKILLGQSRTFLHEDGWLEVLVAMDSATVRKRTKDKISSYRDQVLPFYTSSKVRVQYLEKTIRYLREHGKVYLVRLPVSPALMEIDQELMPEFDTVIAALTPLTSGYLDMTEYNSDFRYTDGVHLDRESGERASALVANWIREKE